MPENAMLYNFVCKAMSKKVSASEFRGFNWLTVIFEKATIRPVMRVSAPIDGIRFFLFLLLRGVPPFFRVNVNRE